LWAEAGEGVERGCGDSSQRGFALPGLAQCLDAAQHGQQETGERMWVGVRPAALS